MRYFIGGTERDYLTYILSLRAVEQLKNTMQMFRSCDIQLKNPFLAKRSPIHVKSTKQLYLLVSSGEHP